MRMEMFRESIVYEDGQILICHKPPGVPVQSARVGVMDLECACRNYLRTAHIGLVQRLDQPVEGLFLVAKTEQAAAERPRSRPRRSGFTVGSDTILSKILEIFIQQ